MKHLLLVALVAFFAFTPPATLNHKERRFARENLKESKKELLRTVKGLNYAQLKFKPAPDRWSVEECLMHIAAAELSLWQATVNGLKQAPNPEKRSEIKVTDKQIFDGAKNRATKFTAPEPIQPKNSGFKNAQEALDSFKENRDRLIEYVRITQEEMRNHVVNFGGQQMDTYQMVLLIASHSIRHTDQIKEVMADPAFPKK